MELELKHLAGYLPYDLKGVISTKHQKNEVELTHLSEYSLKTSPSIHGFEYCSFSEFKPLLRPLSSLDTDKLRADLSGEMSDVINDWILHFKHYAVNKDAAILCAPFPVIQWCYKNHIDIYGLIDKGLAIEIKD